jgi:hypothetical protein
MKVYAIPEPVRRSVAVYVEVNREEDGSAWFETTSLDGGREVVKVDAYAEPPLWARVPVHFAEAIGEALAPRPAATERHLDDAIAVRDRLLALVEKAHEGPRP